tara:strand:- start:1774 stop:2028 length:255 start_codon:yes stop_codon:yes gene_type:complete
MKSLIVLTVFLGFYLNDNAISKTKSEEDALKSLCIIGKKADGKIWGNSRINKAIQILKNGEITSTNKSSLKSSSYKICNLERYI